MPHRIRIGAAALVGAALILAGCSAPADEATGPTTPTGETDVTTITFWNGFTGPDGEALEQRIAAFNAANDDVQVDMTIMPWDVLSQKLLPALGSGEGPDISVNGVEAIPTNAGIGAFGPLDEYYEQWDEQGQLFTALADATVYQGSHYTVPMTYSPMLLYYNKALFAEAGLDPEEIGRAHV
jgi:multiple sugar transport system substrate-binding protein